MSVEFGLTDENTNTRYAPLAALWHYYQQRQMLRPLESVQIPMKRRDFAPQSKLTQILCSILAGCETLSEVNTKLRPEVGLARAGSWGRFADQATLSRTLDALTLTNIEQLRTAVTTIWCQNSQAYHHDWRGFLWLDFDLSGLPCSAQAEASQKGYFSDKKTPPVASWRVSAPSVTANRSGRSCMPAINTASIACVPPYALPKVH
ncbi:MAG: hypothetical protein ACE5FI_17810 [Anaerolineales bacterium]